MMETKKSFCRFCHAACGIQVDVEENRVLAVRGDPDNVFAAPERGGATSGQG